MKALICGVNGQDGAYLAQLLINKNYEVWGTSRDAQMSSLRNLKVLGIEGQVRICSMAQTDFRSVLSALVRSEPNEVYFLSGQSSVGLSFEQPVETLESVAAGTLNMLEAIRFLGGKVRFYNASSSECFGDVGTHPANEATPFRPRSPYAVAKASAHWMVTNYREAYGIFAANGILFNHESPLRPVRFVTQKIIKSALRIAGGADEKLILGRLDIVRDWGWAPEYVDAMWRMLQQETPGDFVIATGVASSLQGFVEEAFTAVGLDWRAHVESDSSLFRPSEISWSQGDPAKAWQQLNWRAETCMPQVVRRMLELRRSDLPGRESC